MTVGFLCGAAPYRVRRTSVDTLGLHRRRPKADLASARRNLAQIRDTAAPVLSELTVAGANMAEIGMNRATITATISIHPMRVPPNNVP